MGDYRFSEEKYQQLCLASGRYDGKITEVKALIKEVRPEERARFGPTTFCPPPKYMLESPLVIACYWGNFKIVKYFLETFPNIIDVDTLGVLSVQYFPELEILPDRIRVAGGFVKAITPLTAACHSNTMKIIKYLISKGAKVNKPSTDGSTPLHYAQSLKTAKYLLECGADINKASNEGIRPLIHLAGKIFCKQREDIQVLRYLLDKNANTYQRTTDAGYTVLHIATFCCKEVVQFLLDSGAPPMFTATSCVTDIDYIPSPAYLAALSGKEAIMEVFLQREDCPIECKVNIYLLKATEHIFLKLYIKRFGVYHAWIKGLEIMKEHDVQLSYPLPVDEYDLREEVKTKEELDAIWDNTLEILFQYALIYERCLGRVCTRYLLEVGQGMIYNGYLKEAESVIKRSVLLETILCEELCSKPPNYYSFPKFHVTECVLNYFEFLIRKLLQRAYLPNFPLYIQFGLTFLRTKCHLQLPVVPEDKREVLTVFSKWIESCESTNSPYPFELISLAKDFVLTYLYYPEGSELLLSNSWFIYQYPSLLRLLLEVGGDAAINDVGWDGRTLLQVALKSLVYEGGDKSEVIRIRELIKIEEVIRILLEYGAHVDTTNRKGLTLFSDIVQSKLPSYKALCSPHLPLSLYCTTANAVVKYSIYYQGLPSRVIDFIKLHDPQYFKQLNYFS